MSESINVKYEKKAVLFDTELSGVCITYKNIVAVEKVIFLKKNSNGEIGQLTIFVKKEKRFTIVFYSVEELRDNYDTLQARINS